MYFTVQEKFFLQVLAVRLPIQYIKLKYLCQYLKYSNFVIDLKDTLDALILATFDAQPTLETCLMLGLRYTVVR